MVAGGENRLLLLEHPPVITLGRGADPANVLASPARLAEEGIELYPAERGGDVTYHGPGEVIVHPIFDLTRHGRALHLFLRRYEEVGIRVLARFSLHGRRGPALHRGLEEMARVFGLTMVRGRGRVGQRGQREEIKGKEGSPWNGNPLVCLRGCGSALLWERPPGGCGKS
ncbi:MAG: hypothetical protein GX493_08190 [Firmicutes bacterium]|nr:hypothetical protein [Bacillota bacterium]